MKHKHKEWTAEFAARTEKILRHAEHAKPSWIRSVDTALFWVLLFLAIIGNFVVSVVLVPFLMTMKGIGLYAMLLFIGITFGWLFSFLMHSMERLHVKQHVIASLFIPALAVINVGIFAILSNKLISVLQLSTPPHNPFFIGAVYVLGYVLPDSVSHFRKK